MARPPPLADLLDEPEIAALVRAGTTIFNGPSPAAARMRRLRERRARSARVVQVEVDVDLLEILEQLGLVGPDEADDPGALAFALLMLLTEAVESRRKIRDASRIGSGLR